MSHDVVVDKSGVYQSLVMKATRASLLGLGRRLSTPLIFLKGAWSEPVLHGGRGKRRVSDVDVLVPAKAFEAFARALPEVGFERHRFDDHEFTNSRSREWTFVPRDGRGLAIDLHRGLASPPYRLDSAKLLARARWYPSVDGPIPSLDPSDQVLYAALHYANHGFAWDKRHLEDTRRVLDVYPVDWGRVSHEATLGGFGFAVRWLADALGSGPLHLRRGWWDGVRIASLRKATLLGGPASTASLWVAHGLFTGRPWYPATSAARYVGSRLGDRLIAKRRKGDYENQ